MLAIARREVDLTKATNNSTGRTWDIRGLPNGVVVDDISDAAFYNDYELAVSTGTLTVDTCAG